MQIRTSPAASILAAGDRMVLRDSDERREFAVAPGQLGAIAEILAACPRWTPFETVVAVAGRALGVYPDRAADALADLAALGMTEIRDDEPRPAFDEPESWHGFGWQEAYRYHRHIRHIPPPDWSRPQAQEEDMATMEAFLAAEAPPGPFLDRVAERSVPLVDRPTGDAPRCVRLSETLTTAGDDGPLTRPDLDRLIRLCFGQTGTRRLPVTGQHIVKTSPSGGSRHPTEVYPVALPGGGLEPGIYHYNVRDHRLDLLRSGDFTDMVRRDVVMVRSRPGFPPRIVFLLTSVVERSMFRYRDSRSYRVLFQDAGHLLQTFAYVSSSLDRPTYRGYTMRFGAVADQLGIDPLAEIPVAYGVLG